MIENVKIDKYENLIYSSLKGGNFFTSDTKLSIVFLNKYIHNLVRRRVCLKNIQHVTKFNVDGYIFFYSNFN